MLAVLNNKINRKRDKSWRVAHPAHANTTVHFLLTYRQAMLLQPGEWRLKISPKRILATCTPNYPFTIATSFQASLNQSSW